MSLSLPAVVWLSFVVDQSKESKKKAKFSSFFRAYRSSFVFPFSSSFFACVFCALLFDCDCENVTCIFHSKHFKLKRVSLFFRFVSGSRLAVLQSPVSTNRKSSARQDFHSFFSSMCRFFFLAQFCHLHRNSICYVVMNLPLDVLCVKISSCVCVCAMVISQQRQVCVAQNH